MNPLAQLTLLSGALVGLGLAVLLWRLVPAHLDLTDYLSRRSLAPGAPSTTSQPPNDARDRVGLWLMRTFPVDRIVKPPTRDLAVLRIGAHRFYAEKLLFGLVGASVPTLASMLLGLFGTHLPIAIPAVGALAFGAAVSFIPDINVRTDADLARTEFRHALAAYIDLVALERTSGTDARQALESAAQIGTSWSYQRLNEELLYSRFAGMPAEASLTRLADELGIPDLSDLADIMRMGGQGATIAHSLHARAASMRGALQAKALTSANASAERMSMPSSLLLSVYMLLLITPALLRMLAVGT